jgi:His/Glu/Gln/Arg/opine family amino acid ABC transporter permease subunit
MLFSLLYKKLFHPIFFYPIMIFKCCKFWLMMTIHMSMCYAQTLKFATSADYPPFEYEEQSQLKGFDVALAKNIAKQLHRPFTIVNMPFNAILPALQHGAIDVAISAIAITPERQKNFDFSKQYYRENLTMVYANESSTLQQLLHQTIACQLGTTMAFWLKQHAPFAKVIEMDNNNQAIASLQAGHVQAILVDASQGNLLHQKNPHFLYRVIATSDAGYGMVVVKGSPLKQDLDNALDHLKQDGTLSALIHQWLETPLATHTCSWMVSAFTIGKGLWLTLPLLLGSLLSGMILAVIFSVLRYQPKLKFTLNRFISLVRGTPLMLQLSLCYFVLPDLIKCPINILTAGIMTLGINSSAYIAEILRAGIESLPKGQFEAAQTLCIPRYAMWKDIILPQVMRNSLPSMINEVIALFKETALIGTIGGMDVMRTAQVIGATHFAYFMPLCIAGAYYYAWVLGIEQLGHFLEKRVNHH